MVIEYGMVWYGTRSWWKQGLPRLLAQKKNTQDFGGERTVGEQKIPKVT